VVWSYDTSADGTSASFHGDALVTDRLVVVGADARPVGHLYGFERDTGKARWKHGFPGGVPVQVLAHGGNVLAVAESGEVVAVDQASGRVVWKFSGPPVDPSTFNRTDPALAGDRLLVGWPSGIVQALDAGTGKQLWQRDLGRPLNTSLIVAGGNAVVGDLRGQLHRLDLDDGKVLPPIDVGSRIYGDLLLADGCVLALTAGEESGMDSALSCVELPSGEIAWSYRVPGELTTFRPLLDGNVVVLGGPERLVGVRLADGAEAWSCAVVGMPRGLSATGDTLFVGTLSGKVNALPRAGCERSAGAATAPTGR
jgi:outer membrane protein assembly factor BamB